MSWSRSKVKRHTGICRFWKIWEIRHHQTFSSKIGTHHYHGNVQYILRNFVLHQVPWEEAVLYLEEMQAFYTAGWMKLMGQE